MKSSRPREYLTAAALLLLAGCSKPAAPPRAMGPVPVATTTARVESVPLFGDWVAQTDGFVDAQIQPQVSGYLVSQTYKEGSVVSKGQVLFEIDPRPFQATLDQAKAAVGQAQAAVAQGQAQLELQQINVKRDTPLAQAHAIAQSTLDNDTQSLRADEAAVASAEAQVRSAEAQVRAAELNLGFTKVRSLISGVAGQALLQVGNLVSTSSVLTTVSQVSPIKVYFSISEQEYLALSNRVRAQGRKDLLSSGNAIPLSLTLANGETYPHPGTIMFVDRAVTAETGSLRIAATFPNPGNLLRPGQFARVKAETDVKRDAILIPQRAMAEVQGAFQVAVVEPGDRVKMVPVVPGPQVGSEIVIASGLKGGEQIVTEGLDKLQDGAPVSPAPARNAGQPGGGDASARPTVASAEKGR